MNVYLFPGQGADAHLFGKIRLNDSFKISCISYPLPTKNLNINGYARSLVNQINVVEPHIFIGTSLGGMLAIELSEVTSPTIVILISSAKNRSELPFGLRMQRWIPVYKIVPAKLIKFGAKIAQPLFEPDRNKEKATFKAMLAAKKPIFLKRTIGMIANWERKSNSSKIIHIHGDSDNTLPIRNIKCDYKIKDGSHMMTLTRGEELNTLILSLLKH